MSNFDLGRKVDCKPKRNTVVKFNFDDAFNRFNEGVESIKEQFVLADELVDKGEVVNASMIWCSQVVLLGSALDFYMHEIVKIGLCKMFDEDWATTDKYKKLSVPMDYVITALDTRDNQEWFLECVNDLFKSKTIMSYKSIKEHLNYFNIKSDVLIDNFECLDKFYTRRNEICHQFNRSHDDSSIIVISKEDVCCYIEQVHNLVKNIDSLLVSKEN